MIQGSLLFGVPDHQQGAAALGLGGAEGGAAANPRRIGTGDEALGGQSFAAVSAESDVLSVAHTGMPALIPYLLPQLGTGNAPVAEHADGHILGNRWGQGLQQFPRWGPSRSRAGRRAGCARPRGWRNCGIPR